MAEPTHNQDSINQRLNTTNLKNFGVELILHLGLSRWRRHGPCVCACAMGVCVMSEGMHERLLWWCWVMGAV